MTAVKKATLTLVALAGLALTGCTVDDGWRDGIMKGTSTSVQAFIKAPVDLIIAALFPK